MILPERLRIISGRTALQQRKSESRLMSSVCFHSAKVMSQTSLVGPAIPTTLARISIVLNSCRVFSTILCTCSSLETSVWKQSALPPLASILEPTCFSSSLTGRISQIETAAPSVAKRLATASACPRPAPVISATFPFNLILIPLYSAQSRLWSSLVRTIPS